MALASRGLRDFGQGPEAIDDDEELTAVRAQARSLGQRAVMITLVITALALIVP